jgi:hypothetical protein
VQFDIGVWIESLRVGISAVPPALIAMVLLGGPTAAWLLYRFVVQPRTRRYRGVDPSAMWICPSCRSVNDLRLARCYRCDAPQQDAEVIDPHPTGPVRLTPVGPGLDLGGVSVMGGPRPITQIGIAPDVWAVEEDDWGAEVEDDRAEVAALSEVAAAPGGRYPVRAPESMPVPPPPRPAATPPRRAIVAGPSNDPDGTPAA